MTKVITALIIAFSGLWFALPAAAQFEIDPDHFDDQPYDTVVRPRPQQSNRPIRVSLVAQTGPAGRAQAFKGRADINRVSNHGSPPRTSHTSGYINRGLLVSGPADGSATVCPRTEAKACRRRGAGFSRFLQLVPGEGESQTTGKPCVLHFLDCRVRCR